MSGSLNLGSISTRLRRIARLAREDPERSFMSLAHYIDEYWLQEAYSRTRKDAAVGVDGTTAEQYAEQLADNLRSLCDRFKSGRYKAPPVRRVHISKGSGSETRPIGIPSFEDKVLQRAVAMVLEAIYEEDFLDCSYGFRPGRSVRGISMNDAVLVTVVDASPRRQTGGSELARLIGGAREQVIRRSGESLVHGTCRNWRF
jgi:hypothetical protein